MHWAIILLAPMIIHIGNRSWCTTRNLPILRTEHVKHFQSENVFDIKIVCCFFVLSGGYWVEMFCTRSAQSVIQEPLVVLWMILCCPQLLVQVWHKFGLPAQEVYTNWLFFSFFFFVVIFGEIFSLMWILSKTEESKNRETNTLSKWKHKIQILYRPFDMIFTIKRTMNIYWVERSRLLNLVELS